MRQSSSSIIKRLFPPATMCRIPWESWTCAGPILRARRAPYSDELGEKPMSDASMYRAIASHVAKLPGAVKEGTRLYSTHSLRATTATLLLLGHSHITTTQIYDKRRCTTKESGGWLWPGESASARCHVPVASEKRPCFSRNRTVLATNAGARRLNRS
jgi:hypothetical protein